MRYAIISDIHGNYPALRAVLDDANTQHIDEYLFAGDYFISLPYPNEVIDTLRGLHARVICGNQLPYIQRPEGDDGQCQISYWCRKTITAENRAYLFSLPERIDFEDGGVGIHMTHSGKALFGDAYLSHYKSSSIPKLYGHAFVPRDRLLRDIRARLTIEDDTPKGVYVFGHSHVQWHAELDGRYLINPGSCGIPLDGGLPGAPYTVLDIQNGAVSIKERRVEYDVEGLIEALSRSDQQRAAPVWTAIIAGELRARRELLSFFFEFVEDYARKIGDEARPYSVPCWEGAYRAWSALDPYSRCDQVSECSGE